MNTTIYAIINQKGGVGKSTTAEALSAGLTLKGFKCLSADLDAASTICLIKGYDGALKYINEEMPEGVEAVFVFENGDIKTTDGSGFEKEQ